jgi:hypothetical protein
VSSVPRDCCSGVETDILPGGHSNTQHYLFSPELDIQGHQQPSLVQKVPLIFILNCALVNRQECSDMCTQVGGE